MSTIRTIIVDDEPLALKLLRTYLNRHSNVEVVAECLNGREAIAKVNELQPHLMFLDIQMPGLSGFDVIQNLQADTMPLVVFVTAYDEYALAAFDVAAVDYLLKPLSESQLERALDRCADRIELSGPSSNKSEIISAIQKIDQKNSSQSPGGANEASNNASNRNDDQPVSQKIVIKDRDVINLLDQADIDWVDAAGDYMCIHVAGETHIMRSTLKALLEQLDQTVFQRVHRSTIVNLNRVEKIIPCGKGEYFLELGNDEQIKVSRNFKTAIKELIAKHEP